MNFFELVNKRQSDRGYIDKSVSSDDIKKIIECARVAPSACNSQPWTFVVVDDKDICEKIAKRVYDPLIGINKFALTAPVFIAIVAEKRNLTSGIGGIVKGVDYTSIDIGIASEHICLAATELGLGTCMMGWFKEKHIKETLNIAKGKEIKLVISLGYVQNEKNRKKVRKNINEILKFNSY